MGAGLYMSLNQSALKQSLLSAFQSMKDGDDTVFAQKVSGAVADYAAMGTIITADVGAVSIGAFSLRRAKTANAVKA